MFSYELLKNHAGMLLCGDFKSLKSLHTVVHEVNEASIRIEDKEGFFLALAYDARKAYEKERRVLNPPEHLPQLGVRYGVEILWPVLLIQCRVLRTSLAFFDSTKQQQAVTSALEDVISTAIKEDFGPQADLILQHWKKIDPTYPDIDYKLDSRGAAFCSWTKAQRKTGLSGLLASFDPMYSALYPVWTKDGISSLLSPKEFDSFAGTEWVDPKW